MNLQRQFGTRRAFAASALAVLGLGGPTLREASSLDINAESVLRAASSRLAEVESLHFTLEVEGDTFIDESGAIRLVSAEGDLSRPDKVAVEFQVSLFGAGTVSIRMITVGAESWTTDLITGNWGEAPPEFGYDPAKLYDNQDGLGPVMGKLDDPQITGAEEIDGRDCHRIVGTVKNEVISILTAGTMGGADVGIELWIDAETSDLRRARVIEPETDDKENPATWELNLSDFDEEVTIEPPE
ncbi:N/A [soil metagenome]